MGRLRKRNSKRVTVRVCVMPDLQRLVGFDSGAADHERDLDVEFVELPLVDGQGELTWGQPKRLVTVGPLPEQKRTVAVRTGVVAVVRGVEDVGVVQLLYTVQFLHHLHHHVVHREKRLPPAGELVCLSDPQENRIIALVQL